MGTMYPLYTMGTMGTIAGKRRESIRSFLKVPTIVPCEIASIICHIMALSTIVPKVPIVPTIPGTIREVSK